MSEIAKSSSETDDEQKDAQSKLEVDVARKREEAAEKELEAAEEKAEDGKSAADNTANDSKPAAQADDAKANGPSNPLLEQMKARDELGHIAAAEMREYRRGRADGLVGIFTLIALLLGFGAYCWWKSYSPMNPPQHISVMFHDVASLNYQAAVYVNGVRVGSVDRIEIKGSDSVQVGIKVNTKKISIPVGSRFIILPNGVVGAKYIEIILPKKNDSSKPQTLLTAKMLVQGDDPIRPEIVVNELVEKLSTLDFSEVQSKLARSLDKMGNVADEVGTLSRKMEPVAEHASKTADSVGALAEEMRAPVNQMHQILDQKHPLMHMVFGRPGHIKEKKEKKETIEKSDGTSTTTTSVETEEADGTKKKKKHHFFHL